MYAFTKSVRKADHVRRYTIQPTASGWEVRTEHNSESVRHACYQDWHRVEFARRIIFLEMASLEQAGWSVDEPEPRTKNEERRTMNGGPKGPR